MLESMNMEDAAAWVVESRPAFASEWFFPINAGLTFLCGLVGKVILDGRAKTEFE